jgi:RNA polymerase sigma factor (sigma-70 family)
MLPLRLQNPDREELFISRYTNLRDQAMRLTDRDAEEAEDLLHDAFIHFTLSQTPVENIQNLDGYLYTMLRNLKLSHARRLARTPQGYLSLIDYDSAEAGLNSTDPRDKIKVQDELRAICQYACVRKESSKAGSVLILRFFHGYYPQEIAQILRSPRSAVDNLLQTARRETRAYKADPDSLTFLHSNATSPQFSFGQISSDILSEVRKAIFAKPGADCPKAEIMELYTSDNDKPITASALSHAVSCKACLEAINDGLGLPSLASRTSADEPKHSDKTPKSGGGSGGSGGGGMTSTDVFLKRSRAKLKQVYEHQPEELLISVNGFIVGSQRINSEMSELALTVNVDERIGFVEVFSERDVCLLFHSVEPPPDGLAVQPASVELSGGRKLDLSLDFRENWPQLFTTYRDPSFREGREFVGETAKAAGTVHVPFDETLEKQTGSWWSRLFDWMQPLRLATAFGLLFVAAIAIWKITEPAAPVSVAQVLQETVTAEQAAAAATDLVVHKTVVLEERDANGSVLATRKIETYKSGEQQLTVRRLFDEHGKLLAGEWKRADGSRTLYSSKDKPKVGQFEVASAPVSIDDAWLLEASAANFQKITTQRDTKIVEDNPIYYTVEYQPDAAGGKLAKARIKITKEGLRVIEQMLLVQDGNSTREFNYTEASYETLSPRAVKPSVFEPEKELLAVLLKDLKLSEPGAIATELPEPEADTATNSNVSASASAATADLEVEALNLLNQAGADQGEQIDVKRAGSVLRIDGLVDSDKRKSEIRNALGPIANNPAVRINILTVAEALAKQQSRTQKTPTSVERISTEGNEVPTKNQLEKYFGSEEAANNFASRMIGRSRGAMSRAGALKRLVGQFTLAELKELSPDARAKWLNLVRGHARGFAQETAALRQDLSPVFGGNAGGQGAPAINDDSSLIRAVTRLFELGAVNDRIVRSALSISTDRSGAALSQEFFRSLRTTEGLAAAVEAYR